MDQGSVFNVSQVHAFAQDYRIKILNLTPYYAQANGQAKSTNKIIKNNLRKVVKNNASNLNELLSKVVWAYQMSKRLSISTTPFSLVYDHDIMLPMKITIKSFKVAQQNELSHI